MARRRENAKRFLRLSAPGRDPASHPHRHSRTDSLVSAGSSGDGSLSGHGEMSSIESGAGDPGAGGGRRASTGRLSQSPASGSRPAQGARETAVALPESAASIPRLPNEKVVASGSGITVSTSLTEPVLFLEGYGRNGRETQKAAVLRGRLHLNVTKPLKIKKVYLSFRGQAIMTLPEDETRINRKKKTPPSPRLISPPFSEDKFTDDLGQEFQARDNNASGNTAS